jgi:hypothetical protein
MRALGASWKVSTKAMSSEPSSLDLTLGKACGLPRLPVPLENAKLDIRANFFTAFNQTNLIMPLQS